MRLGQRLQQLPLALDLTAEREHALEGLLHGLLLQTLQLKQLVPNGLDQLSGRTLLFQPLHLVLKRAHSLVDLLRVDAQFQGEGVPDHGALVDHLELLLEAFLSLHLDVEGGNFGQCVFEFGPQIRLQKLTEGLSKDGLILPQFDQLTQRRKHVVVVAATKHTVNL